MNTKNFRAYFTLVAMMFAIGQPATAENRFSKFVHFLTGNKPVAIQKASIKVGEEAFPTAKQSTEIASVLTQATQPVSENFIETAKVLSGVNTTDREAVGTIWMTDEALKLPVIKKDLLLIPFTQFPNAEPVIADIPTAQKCHCEDLERAHKQDKYARADTGSVYATPVMATYGHQAQVDGKLQLLTANYSEKTAYAGHQMSVTEHLEAARIAAEAAKYDFTSTTLISAASSFIGGRDYKNAALYIKKAYLTGLELNSELMMCAAIYMNDRLLQSQLGPRSHTTVITWRKKKGRHPIST